MHRMHGRASTGRAWTLGSGPSLRLDDHEELRAWACAAASGVRARRIPERWPGEPKDGVHAGAEACEATWDFHLEDASASVSPARLTRSTARWAPSALRVEAAAAFGGVLVPASGVRLLAALDRCGERETVP